MPRVVRAEAAVEAVEVGVAPVVVRRRPVLRRCRVQLRELVVPQPLRLLARVAAVLQAQPKRAGPEVQLPLT